MYPAHARVPIGGSVDSHELQAGGTRRVPDTFRAWPQSAGLFVVIHKNGDPASS
jgi:hypothetical protein